MMRFQAKKSKTEKPLHTPTWIELDSDALRHNCEMVKKRAPKAHILAMVKANGYGHGANWVASHLQGLVQGYGVARLAEAKEIRSANSDARILLLGNLVDDVLLSACADIHTDIVIHDLAGAQAVAKAHLAKPLRCWLKMNIGMNRLGMNEADFTEAHGLLSNSASCAELLHMSHFSESEAQDQTLTNTQSRRLLELSARLGSFPCSQANSAAIIAHPTTHREWVRPGIMLYGDDPTGTLIGNQALRPVMHFKSRVIALKEVAAGEGVGYNHRWVAPEKRLIATVAAGYADGYPRNAPDGTPVLIHGQRAALAGRVSMDLMTVDVSRLSQVAIGDEVTLWGNGLPAAEVGQHCGTISYELFTRITARVARHYR